MPVPPSSLASNPLAGSLQRLVRTFRDESRTPKLKGRGERVEQAPAPILSSGAGYGEREEAQPSVRALQRSLRRAGYGVGVDGLFGPQTASALRAFQEDSGLIPDAVAGPRTWASLGKRVSAPRGGEKIFGTNPELSDFKGSLDWIASREGFEGNPYIPPGRASGITLDPGIDLGQQSTETIQEIFSGILPEADVQALQSAAGLSGSAARRYLDEDSALQGIQISEKQAKQALGRIAGKYWDQVKRRFPNINNAPPTVQTSVLSLAYNRGPYNRELLAIRDPIREHRWRDVSQRIRTMQQDHPVRGVARRRREEASLINRRDIADRDSEEYLGATPRGPTSNKPEISLYERVRSRLSNLLG